jgi:hypothetical protein
MLKKALTFRTVSVRGENTSVPLKLDQAIDTRYFYRFFPPCLRLQFYTLYISAEYRI